MPSQALASPHREPLTCNLHFSALAKGAEMTDSDSAVVIAHYAIEIVTSQASINRFRTNAVVVGLVSFLFVGFAVFVALRLRVYRIKMQPSDFTSLFDAMVMKPPPSQNKKRTLHWCLQLPRGCLTGCRPLRSGRRVQSATEIGGECVCLSAANYLHHLC